MRVPFLNLKALHQPLQEELTAGFQATLEESTFVHGQAIQDFEQAFAAFAEVPFCVSVGNGTDALVLALKALSLQAGDEVVTVANTFVATVEAILAVGARPRLIDATPGTLLMDAEKLPAALSPRTKVCIPVHLYGQMVELGRLQAMAQTHSFDLIEDAAQAHGAKDSQGKTPGQGSKMATYSFFPGKNLGALGDAGAIVCQNPSVARVCQQLKNHGSLKKYHHDLVGYNSRLDTLQARFLSIKLRYLKAWNTRRAQVAAWYRQGLQDVESIQLPTFQPGGLSSLHLFVVQVPERDKLRQLLQDQGIETGLHYPTPIHLIPAYQDLGYRRGDFPVVEAAMDRILSLPMCPTLSQDQVFYVCECLRRFCASPHRKGGNT